MPASAFRPGDVYSGFVVLENTPLPEQNLNLVRLEHQRTGARYLHMETDDTNNLFAVSFRTPPSDSTGVAHILEHTVLCGSQKYPVRDPFFSMLKRSLNTFMNAMTASDWTSYPFASQNARDFENLLGIYLDATFFPELREQDFRQEGHRLEFSQADDPKSPLSIQGVVYNEMKGAMASPSSLLSRRLGRALYPTTTYHHNSGGEPQNIPDLTWQQLRDFHASFYHPSNSWIFSYGNLPLQGHLKKVDALALSRFERRAVDSEVPSEERFRAPRQCEETYALAPDESPEGKSMVQLAWLTNDIDDSYLRLVMNLLSVLLLGTPASPLYRALLESRLGSNLTPGCGYHDENRSTCFAAGLQGTDPEQADAIEQLILTTLEQVAREGFEPERVEGALHRLEFSNREVSGDSYPYPLVLLMRLLGPWLHADDPLSPLRLDVHLTKLRAALKDPDYLPGLIRKMLLDNPHRVRLLLRPDQGQQAREEEELRARLDQLKASLSAEKIREIVDQAAQLKARQEAEDDLSCLPTLGRTDIPAQEEKVTGKRDICAGHPLVSFDQPTNGISYFVSHLSARGLGPRQLGELPILASMLPQVGAGGRSYLENAALVERYTGGLQAGTELLENPADPRDFQVNLVVKGKTLVRNQSHLLGLLGDMLLQPDFDDLERLSTLLGQFRASLENSIPGSGHSYAARYAAASLTPAAAQREQWGGISLLRQIRKLSEGDDQELAALSARLKRLAESLAGTEQLASVLTCEEEHRDTLIRPITPFIEKFSASGQSSAPAATSFTGQASYTGLSTSVPVAYVARVFPTVAYNHPDSPLLLVLAKLLRAGYLHREIREKGGAYGGLAGCNTEGGTFSMLSYRDPQIVRTLQVYDAAAEWAAGGSFSEQDVDEAVLSVFSDLDRPLSPGGRGSREFAHQLQGLTRELRQEFRERALAATREDLARVAGRYLVGGRKQSATAVIAGRDLLEKANSELGSEGLAIEAI